jgi:hypothetical protein
LCGAEAPGFEIRQWDCGRRARKTLDRQHRNHASRARAEGESKVKGWKWAGNLQIQIGIIVALLFIIWIVLQQQYY